MNDLFYNTLKIERGIEVDGRYYAENYLKNIFPDQMAEEHIRMFCRGGGKELYPSEGRTEKAACLYSSSMLAYNFFHWIGKDTTLTLDGVEYDKVVFEEQFRVLVNRNNKANMDVVLVSKDEKTILLLESKFTEHLKPGAVDIKAVYENPSSYFSKGEKWVNVIKCLKRMMKQDSEKDTYYEGLKQVACHLMGISNVILNDKARAWFNSNSWLKNQFGCCLDGDKEYIFKSLVFHPRTEQEDIASGNYEDKNKEFVSMMDFLPPTLRIDNPVITYRDLWERGMKKSIKDSSLKDYLEKYLSVHK